MDKVRLGGVFDVTCRDKSGKVKWQDKAKNLVVGEGLAHILDVSLTGGTQVDPWYIGLLSSGPTVATGDVISTHGFTEFTDYDESTRVAFTEGRTGVSVSNTGNLATFTIDADGSVIGGALIASSENAGGSAGTLLCAAAFSGGDKSGDSGDKLEVTYTFTAADDGV